MEQRRAVAHSIACVEWEAQNDSEMMEKLVVIAELELGLHNDTFNCKNHSSGSVQVM